MKELKRQQAYYSALAVWQPTCYFLGTGSQDCFAKELLKVYSDDEKKGENIPVLCMYSSRMGMFVVSGEYQKAAELFISYGFAWPKGGRCHPLFMSAVCNGGFAAWAVAGSSRKFKNAARKARSFVRRWAAKGNPNVKHWKALFDAEGDVLGRRRKKAEEKYQSAITLAERGGYTQDCALANERYGNFLLINSSEPKEAAFHISKAVELYLKWGAVRKVEEMRAKYSSILE